jgi:hypothetical protein
MSSSTTAVGVSCLEALITGGSPAVRGYVVKLDTLREFAYQLSLLCTLLGAAMQQCITPSVYMYWAGTEVTGNLEGVCEVRMCRESMGSAAMLVACYCLSAVVLENSLYALGGRNAEVVFDRVQKLSLDSLTWELMRLRLPQADYVIPCFKFRDAKVCLEINKTLYSFTPLKVTELKTLPEDIKSWFGVSHYCRGTLYCSSFTGAAGRLDIAQLS